jgi:hypothetical protein
MTQKLVIEISGGCYCGISSNEPIDFDIYLVDWDNIASPEEASTRYLLGKGILARDPITGDLHINERIFEYVG